MTLSASDTLFNLDRFFDNFYSSYTPPVKHTYAFQPDDKEVVLTPRVDILKEGQNYQLIAELPGVNKEQLSVTVKDNTLTIETHTVTAEEQSESEQKTVQYLRKERKCGKFYRSFDLGKNIEQSAIQANFKDGLLIIDIPGQQEKTASSKRIDIH